MLTDADRVPIGRRAWIGDGRSGASVAPDGTVDWYSSGGLTAEPLLWRLLDRRGAAVRVGPLRSGTGTARFLPPAELRYRAASNTVETTARAAGGRSVSVVDFVPWTGSGTDSPDCVVRLVRALAGPVEIEVEVLPGPGDARRPVAAGGVLVAGALEVRAPGDFRAAPLRPDLERWQARFLLEEGERAVVTVARTGQSPALSIDGAEDLLARTDEAWRSWVAPAVLAGPYGDAARRSLLAVGAVTAPTGAPAAAGTTSLPRRAGTDRTSDDRWVRIRDVAVAVGTLARVGLAEDSEAAEEWLRRVVTDVPLFWPAWLDADGQPVPEADEWPLDGWRRSGPVWWGRRPEAGDPGLFGAVMSAVDGCRRGPYGGSGEGQAGPLSAARAGLGAAADWICDHWSEPDHGRWEIERPSRTYVSGRVGAWFGLRGLAAQARAANPLDLEAVTWHTEATRIERWLEDQAAPTGLLPLAGDGPSQPDAALLELAWRGPWPAGHPVVRATVGTILGRLASGPLLHRYADSVSDGREGPDLPDLESTLMGVRALASLGCWEEAHDRMEAVVSLLAGGSGLPAQTADPVSGEIFGNLPGTAAALALVDTALDLEAGPE